jgi:hypothetical protein
MCKSEAIPYQIIGLNARRKGKKMRGKEVEG